MDSYSYHDPTVYDVLAMVVIKLNKYFGTKIPLYEAIDPYTHKIKLSKFDSECEDIIVDNKFIANNITDMLMGVMTERVSRD